MVMFSIFSRLYNVKYVLISVSLVTLYIWYYFQSTTTGISTNTDLATHHVTEPIRVHYFNKPKGINGSRFEICKHRCYLTHGMSSYRTSHVVIFHGPTLGSFVTSPPMKYPRQIWILHGKESPVNYVGSLKSWKRVFNWTMTYRRDSDIAALNGIFATESGYVDSVNRSSLFQSKMKNIAWFVSNCHTHGGREKYVDTLRDLMDVTVYGKCGKQKCPRSKDKKCMEILRGYFKFYLSFENSLCHDYITEKGFKVYRYNSYVIPVTRGLTGTQYQMYLPQSSYINTEDFRSVPKLVTRLLSIAENETLYNTYFEWENRYTADLYTPQDFCQLCERLHNEDRYRSLYDDISHWWTNEPYRNVCRSKHDVEL
ncbi:glycoprotein 3-alpha-L-fucosyltransferase A-like [Argopecten irradians]|uniref:glycoprotein 3-alpha-L-fucosyltransferase A-like n=1 Tax=Argopecten irradians TaxID=31199 RepID=UPI0037101CD3